MSLTDQDVAHVARLARLSLQSDERQKMKEQLSKILDYMKALERYDVKDVTPTSHVVPLTNAWREDSAQPFQDAESILANAPDREETYFKVKKVIESA